MPTIKITVDGKPAHTTDQLATMYEIQPGSMRMRLHRHGIEPVANLDGRTPLYLAAPTLKKLGLNPATQRAAEAMSDPQVNPSKYGVGGLSGRSKD
jgi:hypothetical protein